MPDYRPYREGKIHVMAEKCATCVFRPGNPMHLSEGRLADLVEGNLEQDSALQCHKTLPYSPEQLDGAICNGFFDGYWERSAPLRLAMGMDLLEFVAYASAATPLPQEEQ